MPLAGKSDFKTALDSAAKLRNGNANADLVQRELRVARFAVTIVGTEESGDYHELGPLLIKGATIIPEQIRLRFGGSGSFNNTVTIKKVDKNGANSVTLTNTATVSATTSVITFTAAAATLFAELAADDVLRLELTAVTTVAAGRILYVEVPYYVNGR